MPDINYVPISSLLVAGGADEDTLIPVSDGTTVFAVRVRDLRLEVSGDVLPYVTSTDNGKFLRVVNGQWVAGDFDVQETQNAGGGTTVTIT